MHMELQRKTLLCSFDDVLVATCIPVRFESQVNRKSAAASRHNRGGGSIMTITLKKIPAVAPKGHNPGVFTDITQEIGKDDLGKDYNRLKVVVTLEAKDPDGKPFQVEKTYNLLGRGVRDFRADFLAWSDRLLTEDELGSFNADSEMKGKAVIVELSHRKDGKNKLVAEIEKFLPVPAPAQGNGN